MNRHSEIVTNGTVSIETYTDGRGPAVVVLPSYGRGGGDDFDKFTIALVGEGYRVLRPQPRGVGRSTHSASPPSAVSPYPLARRGGVAAAVEAGRPDQLFRRELGLSGSCGRRFRCLGERRNKTGSGQVVDYSCQLHRFGAPSNDSQWPDSEGSFKLQGLKEKKSWDSRGQTSFPACR
jgi:hypothetical protein